MQLIEDLLLLLTGQRIYVPWPTIIGRGKICTYYFARNAEVARPVKSSDCWTSWGIVQSSFGRLFDALRRGRDELGPGLYLYLGTRRASKLFIENRFMNLIWGLESLHRKTPECTETDGNGLQAKIDRILDQIEAPKDKKWLTNKLKNDLAPVSRIP